MSAFGAFKTADLKLVYRVLHAHLTEHLDLMDSAFFEQLQQHLQARAKAEGADPTDHRQWDLWLGGEPVDCSERVIRRQTLRLVPNEPSDR